MVISGGALIPSGGAFFTTKKVFKAKSKRKSPAKPLRNQAKFAPTLPRVDTSVCANTAKRANFPPTPRFRKIIKPKRNCNKEKPRKFGSSRRLQRQNTRHHGIARRTPRKSLINGFFSAQMPIFILPFFNHNAIQIGHRFRR